ncbi:MAG TPA: glycosyltransferase family 1 protein [Acidimicrobiia bacterium]
MARTRIVLNALSLRRDGSGVQTYVRELLGALPGAWPDANFAARVAQSAAALVPAGVVPVPVRLGADHGLARRVRSLVPAHDADLVHALDTDATIAGAPSVVTVHDLALFDVPDAFDARRGRAKRVLVAGAIRRADAIVSVSAFTAERVRERFGRDSTVVLEAPGRNFAPAGAAAIADVRERYALPECFVLHLGNLEPRKDLGTLAAACGDVGVPLVLAGGAINTAGPPPNVHALGYVPTADLPALYGAARVVAYVSRYEGFALPPVEAMACGAVVMATPVGALPDVAGEGVEVVTVGDVDAQAGALRELLHDDDRRNERRAAAVRAVGELSWERAARDTVAVYQRLL